MMNLKEHLKAANLHADRMMLAKDKLQLIIPLTFEKIDSLTVEELGYLELYTGRFAKLQDILGNKIFPELLEASAHEISALTMIDRLNLLERLEVLKSFDEWMEMRKVRNEFAHEYPDQAEFLVNNLNKAFDMGKKLMECLDRSIAFAKRVGIE
jgi:hypothetical protein